MCCQMGNWSLGLSWSTPILPGHGKKDQISYWGKAGPSTFLPGPKTPTPPVQAFNRGAQAGVTGSTGCLGGKKKTEFLSSS